MIHLISQQKEHVLELVGIGIIHRAVINKMTVECAFSSPVISMIICLSALKTMDRFQHDRIAELAV